MSFVNQLPGLPFNYQMATSQPFQYNLSAPPFIPNNADYPQNLAYLLPAVCAMIANEAGARCNQHAGRIFLFNQLSSNNFANNEFVKVVGMAFDVLVLGLAENRFQNPDQGVGVAVSEALAYFCSLNYQIYQSLASVTPPEVVNDVNNTLGMFNNFTNRIMSLKNRNMGMTQGGYQGHQQMMNNNMPGGYQQPNPYVQQPYRPNQMPAGGSANTGIFNRGGQTQAQVGNNNQPMLENSDKYAYLKNNTTATQQTSVNIAIPQPIQTTQVPIAEDLKKIGWHPTYDQVYPFTINPNKYFLILRRNRNSKEIEVYPEPLTEEQIMDRSKHTITTMQQAVMGNIPLAYNTREESLTDSIDRMFAVTREDVDNFKANEFNPEVTDEFNEIKTLINPHFPAFTFLDEAILQGRVNQKTAMLSDTDCTAFRSYAVIAKPIVGDANHEDFIVKLGKLKSFREIRDVLYETIVVEKHNKSLIKLCRQIDKFLTDEINGVIKNRMSITNSEFESFIDDINDIPAHLEGLYGESYKKTFLEFQKNYIPLLIGSCEDEMAGAIQSNYGIENNDYAYMNFITQVYSITYLNVESNELNFEPYDECASIIIEGLTPLLKKIVKGIFEQDEELDHHAAHHLIVTNDDVIYEIHRGLIGKDCFTVNVMRK